MTVKKRRNKIAKMLRRGFGISFGEAHKLARKEEIHLSDVISDKVEIVSVSEFYDSQDDYYGRNLTVKGIDGAEYHFSEIREIFCPGV